jgi:hypothetical protein
VDHCKSDMSCDYARARMHAIVLTMRACIDTHTMRLPTCLLLPVCLSLLARLLTPTHTEITYRLSCTSLRSAALDAKMIVRAFTHV